MENNFNKYERSFNKFMAWLFGVMTAIAVVGIFWNPAQFVIAGISALLCWVFIRETRLLK